MDFAGMKQRELQALCREHGLAARGSKADLAASLAGAISEAASTAAAEKVVEVMVGKGCLKRSGNGPSGGSSGAVFKKVTFSFKEMEESGEALVAAKVSRRGCRQKHIETVSSGEGVAGELCADAQVIWSRTNAVNLRAGGGIERRDNLAEEEREVVGATVDRKQRTHENPKRIAASVQAGVSRRSTRKSVSSTAVDTSVQSQNEPADKEGEVIGGADLAEAERDGKVVRKAVDSKRKQKTLQNAKNTAANAHAGISRRSTRKSISSTAVDTWVQGQNDSAEKEGNAIGGAGLAEADEDGKVVRKAIDIQKTLQNAKNLAANAHAGISRRSTRKSISSTTVDISIQSQIDPAEQEGEVIGGAGHTKLKSKTAGKLKVGETVPAAAISGRGCQHMCIEERGSNASVEGVTGRVGSDARETRSNRNVGNLCADSGVERQNILAEAEENGKVVRKAVDNKRKQKTLQNSENMAANADAGISHISKRSSILSADDVLLCHIVGKKRGRRTAEPGVVKKSSEVQNLLPAASPDIIESKKSQRKEEYCKLAEQKSAKVALSDRVTRSCSVHAAALLPVAIEDKMKNETVHLDRVAPAVSKSDVPRNDAPITRSLRNRAIQKNNTMLEETHVGKKLEKKRQPRGSAIGRHKQFSSSLEEEVQAAAPCKSPPLLENARGEEIKNDQCEDVGKQPPVRRSACNRVVAS